MIYSDGTTNIVSGSAIVRGTGTQWKSNINGIAAGQIISIQSGNTVIQNVIQSVNSDTELVLAFAPSINLNNANYVISTTVPDTVSDGVRHICAINAYIIQFLQNMDRWMSESGKVDVEMPNGQKVTLDSIRALQAGVEGKLDKFQNGADIPNIDTFNKNIGSCRAFSNGIDMGGNGTWTTFEFINWLKNYGAFEHPYWMCVGTFNYGKNRIITDTKCGHIHLAGAAVEVMGAYNFMTIRVTTAPDAADGGVPAAQFIYADYGVGYKPGWRRDYNTVLKPTLDELGLTDTVARADNAILQNSRQGELQTINSNLLI
ncbi:hypothetical protein KKJ04_21325, partial [Xenorhabdus bovienii]|nr:hypothetical protein [Xenorhabdus bovienii]